MIQDKSAVADVHNMSPQLLGGFVSAERLTHGGETRKNGRDLRVVLALALLEVE